MINVVGLLCKGNEEMVPFAYRLYARSLELQSADRVAAQKAKQKATGKKYSSYSVTTEDATEYDDASSDETDALLRKNSDPESQTTVAESHGTEETGDCPHSENLLAGNIDVKESDDTKAALKEIKAFGETFCRSAGDTITNNHENIQVFFLGLWDCVNSVAVVEKSAPAPVEVAGTAKYIRHAVAVDERRVKFKPALFAQDIRNEHKKNEQCAKSQQHRDDQKKSNIREVWFPGNHGDVGGGWPAFEQTSPSKMGYWESFKRAWSSFKVKKVKQVLDDNRLQMSDMALEWMIREIDLVGRREPKAKVHWSPGYDHFKVLMSDKEAVAANITRGFMHDCLSFGRGTSLFKVLMWKFFGKLPIPCPSVWIILLLTKVFTLEHLPFIPRWELNDFENKDERGWESYRGWPNRSAYRDIPRKAYLHESLRQRLLENKETYNPQNNHGSKAPNSHRAGEPCLRQRNGEAAVMYEVPKNSAKSEEWDGRHRIWTLGKDL